jgi:hypothetical protein
MKQNNKRSLKETYYSRIFLKAINIKIGIFLSVFLHVLFLNAQGTEPVDLPNIIPMSPEASSLAKFTETPVSYYTGLPNISIPIYTIDQKGIKIPIDISYHARGIQVGEIASRVGLGWALNYGGSISRQTRGIEDERSFYGYLSLDYLKDFFMNPTVINNIYNMYVDHPEFDFDPDVFHFNANGVSGKFLFDQKDKKPVVQKFDDLKIDYTRDQNGISSFKITDKSGNKFYYGISKDGQRFARNVDIVLNDFIYSNSATVADVTGVENRYFNAWQLMDIETPNGDIINYIYESDESIFYRRSYDKYESNIGVLQSYFSKINSIQFQLKEIRFNNGKLVFEKSTIPREDLPYSYSLNKINLLDKNDKFISSFKLDHETVVSDLDNNQLTHLKNADPSGSKRMFLKSITQKDSIGNSIPPYLFQYNSQKLPNRFSNSQDTWGYYNGANNGQYLTFYDYGTQIDRTVNTVKSQAGMLEKITFPDGGYTSYFYEQNSAIPPQSFKNLVVNTINPVVVMSNGLSNLENQLYYSNGVYLKTIIIGPNVIGDIDFDVSFTDETSCSSSALIPECKFEVSIYNSQLNYPLYIGESQISLPPGSYTLKVVPKNHIHDPFHMMHGFNIIMNWFEESINENEMILAAGKRIKRIESGNSVGQLSLVKEFSYVDDAGNTSGKLFGLPNFKSLNGDISNPYNITSPYGSIPGSPLNVSQGNTVGYSKVTEYIGRNVNNIGKIERTFTCFEDSGKYYEFPYHLPTDNEWLRGKNLSTSYFENENGNYRLIKNIENEYLFGNTDNENIFVGELFISNPISATPNPWIKNDVQFLLPLIIFTDEMNNFKIYFQNGGSFNLKKTTEIDYFSSSSSLFRISEYFYDYSKHYQVKSVESTKSNGSNVSTTFYYPDDVVSTNSLPGGSILGLELNAIISLNSKNQHRISEPIQVDKLENGQLTTTRTIFKDWKANSIGGRIIEPQFIKSQKGIGIFENRITFYDYDAYGNVLDVSKTLGSRTSYIWGYNNQYPIAKFENLNYSAISLSTINDLKTKSNLDISATTENTLRSALNGLRSSYTGSMINTYTYNPLVGMTSATDPSGYTTFYEYDAFNRLEFIENKDSKVVKSYDYHYKTNISQFAISSITNGNGIVTLSETVVNEGENVTVTITPNSGYQISSIKVNGVPRSISSSFTISNITSATVVDVQFSVVAAAFAVTPTSIDFEWIDVPKTVNVTASGNWTVSKSAIWIAISATSGSGNGSFTVKPRKNIGSERIGTVTVTQSGTSKTITIRQFSEI